MPVRATKRGADRTPLNGDADVLVCGASFAGLSVARELAGSGARVLVVDRYEIGERQTSACAAPTDWLHNLGLQASIRQTFGELVVNTARGRIDYRLPWTFSTFDYRELCALLAQQGDFTFETAKVESITRGDVHTVTTDRGDLRAPLVVDALGWRRVLGRDLRIQPPEARLSRGLEVHPAGTGRDLELWIDPRVVRAGYGWRFPAQDEVRIGVGSFDPHDHVKDPTVALTRELGKEPEGYQGNWIPHQLRPSVSEDVFFAGDSAGHCLPLTAEGIRTAFYFGLAVGRELRAVVEGRQTRAQALAAYGAFSAAHARPYKWLLNMQHCVGPMNVRGPLVHWTMKAINQRRLIDAFFNRYLAVAPPDYALADGAPRRTGTPVAA
jgi:flavin-dependent dehydrogenase